MSRAPLACVAAAALLFAGSCRTGAVSAGGTPVQPRSSNRPPTVRASCDPCSIATGATVRLTAEAQDADGDALTYAWSAPAGSAATATAKQTTWTAPTAAGAVPISVRVSDGKGGLASDVVTITVR